MIKVLIADDHPAFRTGLKSVLADNNEGLLIDVEEAKNGQEVLNRLTARTYDLIFLDVAMPGRNGLEILEDIKKNRPKTNVLMMSMYSEEQYAVRAMKAGAAGYLTKDGEPDDIITAVKNVMAGRKHFSASVFEQLVFELENSGEKKMHEKLSAREYQVMRMIAAGKKLTHIAEELSVSLSTASTHRLRILKKMNMDSNADIIKYALKEGLIE